MPYEGRPIIPPTKPIPGKSAFSRFKKSISSSAANTPNLNLISGLVALGIAASSGLVASIKQAHYNRKYKISPDEKSVLYTQAEELINENEELIDEAIDKDDMQRSMEVGGKRKSKKKRPTKKRRLTKKRRPTKRRRARKSSRAR